ncbi:hypothetical protein RZS28_17275 [Methylocapsa polymorpha]|uniref:Class I SAM-dependent methyltransferase n=1 Tax=Methylocapsa polymorpha TaxID=3080828 RepID=A0ABZ0HRH2_9HYPH|nr:hypothetical protein RZS28_17275 [Methylocapsa sp. RX1]
MFANVVEIRATFHEIGQAIRAGKLGVEPHRYPYALGLAHGVCQAIHCGYDSLVAVELGVAHGNGLMNLCRAAAYFRERFRFSIDVYGFDNAAGLPEPQGYKDHPEIWSKGDFARPDHEGVRVGLPEFGHLIIGDVGETVRAFEQTLGDRHLAFVSVDLDYYSSTKRAMPLFQFAPERYIPALPVYFDDVRGLISMNPWCGEELAISEFNAENEMRKIARKDYGVHPQFYICHVLDHPIRQGTIKPKFSFEIWPF